MIPAKPPVCGDGNLFKDEACDDGNLKDGDGCSATCKKEATWGFVAIAASEFWMGCNEQLDTKCQAQEKPYHKVKLSGYFIGKTEVTVAEYKKCVQAGVCNPAIGQPTYDQNKPQQQCTYNWTGLESYPVNCAPWSDADAYCKWIGGRLPTEAEWEHAARGTDGRLFPWGNTADQQNYYKSDGSRPDPVGTHPKDVSPYGVLDMAGSVQELVQDYYDQAYYQSSPSQDPTGPSTGNYRTARGGQWNADIFTARTSNRSVASSLWGNNTSNPQQGFRCVIAQKK